MLLLSLLRLIKSSISVVRRNVINKKLIYLFLFLGAIFIGGGSKVQAQIIGDLKASIPFDFHAGGATLPAGTYTINVLEGAENDLIEIRNADRHTSALIETRDAWAKSLPKTSELLFNHVDGNYYLASIFNQENRNGVAVFDSDYSKKYGKKLAPVDPTRVAAVIKTN